MQTIAEFCLSKLDGWVIGGYIAGSTGLLSANPARALPVDGFDLWEDRPDEGFAKMQGNGKKTGYMKGAGISEEQVTPAGATGRSDVK